MGKDCCISIMWHEREKRRSILPGAFLESVSLTGQSTNVFGSEKSFCNLLARSMREVQRISRIGP